MENLHFEYNHAFQLITDFYVKKVPDTTGMSFTFLRKKVPDQLQVGHSECLWSVDPVSFYINKEYMWVHPTRSHGFVHVQFVCSLTWPSSVKEESSLLQNSPLV